MTAPRLTGQHFGTKSITSQFKHLPTSTPEHPSSWITGGCQIPPCSKSIGVVNTRKQVFNLHDRRSTNWATDHAGRNEWNNFDWWLLSFTANMALTPTNLGSQYMMKVRIHNNCEGRGQHPELTGQRFWTKSVTSQKYPQLNPDPREKWKEWQNVISHAKHVPS